MDSVGDGAGHRIRIPDCRSPPTSILLSVKSVLREALHYVLMGIWLPGSFSLKPAGKGVSPEEADSHSTLQSGFLGDE